MTLASASPLGVLLAALLAFAPARAAEPPLRFHADPAAADLVCPSPPPAAAAPGPAAEAGQVPPPPALGALAEAVVRPPPPLPSAIREGFDPDAGGPPRRIAVWGDSHVAAGPFMPTLAARLQARGLAVSAAFLPPSMGRANVRLGSLRAFCIGTGWSTERAYTAGGPVAVGPGLINRIAAGGPESYLWLDLRAADGGRPVRGLHLVYRAPEGAAVAVSVDGGPEQSADLAPGGRSRTLDIDADGPLATLKLRTRRGPLVFDGVRLDPVRPPALTLDVFGVPSATVEGWANLDPDAFIQSLHGLAYDAVILEYGTNDASAPDFDADRYAEVLRTALGHLRRVFPRAACLLVGPPDRGVLWRAGAAPDVLTFARRMQAAAAVQARIGPAFGCATWNWQALMGGPGGSYGWALRAPPLMGRDLTHLTGAGYRLTGEALAQSLGF